MAAQHVNVCDDLLTAEMSSPSSDGYDMVADIDQLKLSDAESGSDFEVVVEDMCASTASASVSTCISISSNTDNEENDDNDSLSSVSSGQRISPFEAEDLEVPVVPAESLNSYGELQGVLRYQEITALFGLPPPIVTSILINRLRGFGKKAEEVSQLCDV